MNNSMLKILLVEKNHFQDFFNELEFLLFWNKAFGDV
jgi:hypothetical protein